MAHSLSAKKRIRQNLKAQRRNRWRKRTMRKAIYDFRDKALHSGDHDYTAIQDSFRRACAAVDKTASKGVIHKNQAARRKSRMASRLKQIAQAKNA